MASSTKKTWNIRYRKRAAAGKKRKNRINIDGTTKARSELFEVSKLSSNL